MKADHLVTTLAVCGAYFLMMALHENMRALMRASRQNALAFAVYKPSSGHNILGCPDVWIDISWHPCGILRTVNEHLRKVQCLTCLARCTFANRLLRVKELQPCQAPKGRQTKPQPVGPQIGSMLDRFVQCRA